MKRLNERTIKALCALEGDPNFRIIQEWFLESAAEQDQILRNAESNILFHRAQGASKELLEFCEKSATPRELAKKLAGEKVGIFNT